MTTPLVFSTKNVTTVGNLSKGFVLVSDPETSHTRNLSGCTLPYGYIILVAETHFWGAENHHPGWIIVNCKQLER